MYWSITEYHRKSFYCYEKSSIWFYFRTLGYLVSDSWSPKMWQLWFESHGEGHNSNQTLGWLLLQALGHHCPNIFCRQKRTIDQKVCGLVCTNIFVLITCRVPSHTNQNDICKMLYLKTISEIQSLFHFLFSLE